jgi:hypothetical protein
VQGTGVVGALPLEFAVTCVVEVVPPVALPPGLFGVILIMVCVWEVEPPIPGVMDFPTVLPVPDFTPVEPAPVPDNDPDEPEVEPLPEPVVVPVFVPVVEPMPVPEVEPLPVPEVWPMPGLIPMPVPEVEPEVEPMPVPGDEPMPVPELEPEDEPEVAPLPCVDIVDCVPLPRPVTGMIVCPPVEFPDPK